MASDLCGQHFLNGLNITSYTVRDSLSCFNEELEEFVGFPWMSEDLFVMIPLSKISMFAIIHKEV